MSQPSTRKSAAKQDQLEPRASTPHIKRSGGRFSFRWQRPLGAVGASEKQLRSSPGTAGEATEITGDTRFTPARHGGRRSSCLARSFS
eukprot:7185069-Prymnesium_polylepis.1